MGGAKILMLDVESFLQLCILSALFFVGVMQCTQTGCAVDVYTPKGFIKILTQNVERGWGVQKFWGTGGD